MLKYSSALQKGMAEMSLMGFKLWQGGLLMQQKGWEKDLIHKEGPDPGHCDPCAVQEAAGMGSATTSMGKIFQ